MSYLKLWNKIDRPSCPSSPSRRRRRRPLSVRLSCRPSRRRRPSSVRPSRRVPSLPSSSSVRPSRRTPRRLMLTVMQDADMPGPLVHGHDAQEDKECDRTWMFMVTLPNQKIEIYQFGANM